MPDDPTAASAPAAAPHSTVLEAVWASSPLALLTLEADGTVASINPAGERMMQASAAEIIGERFSERAHRMDRALVRSLVEEAAAGGLPVRREIRFEQPGAPPRVGGMSIASLGPGSNGQSVVVVRDVTAERAPAAVASVAAMVEHEVKRPLALAREALEGLEPRWRDAGGEHARGSLEVSLHGIDQAASIVEARLSDISARLKAETDLRASEQRFRALVEQSIDPLFLTDEAGLILEVNPSAVVALGLPREALLGANFIEFAVVRSPHDGRLPWAVVFSAPDLPRTDELTLRRADGTTFPAEIRTVSIGGDGPPRCLSVARDLTERKRQLDATREAHAELERRVQLRTAELVGANAELERASRMKDEFLASMSHELRTPLNAVLGLSEALVEGVYGPLNQRQTRGLSSIHESGRHLLELINDVLDITKIAAGRLAVDRIPVDVSDMGLASLRVVREAATRKGLALDLLLDPDVCAVAADPRRLKQVLLNLLSNAVKKSHRPIKVCFPK
jgi:PAS domain S-box-containing protein